VTFRRAVLVAAAAFLAACGAAAPPAGTATRPVVLGEIPHDRSAFTEGLQLAGGLLYEGTGLAGRSELRETDPATGAVRRAVPLPGGYFGEGVAVTGDRIWQLTYTEGVALEWDRATLTLRRSVPFTSGEGWGLCLDGTRLVQSEGTDRLLFRDPATFAETGSVRVTLDGAPIDQLNELECVDGQVWANVWRTERLVRIDPASGRVTATVDASGLLTPDQRAGTDVMNGIAWLGGDEYLLTGKFWPVMVRVRLPGDPPAR
jgi:glutaminyl-peptide cyclotransferase